MRNAPCVIVPTSVLMENHFPLPQSLTEKGICVHDLVEIALIARNQADDTRLKHVGIRGDVVDFITDEVSELISPHSYTHLNSTQRQECLASSIKFSTGAYFFLRSILETVIGDLDDYDGNLICEEWLARDIVVSFQSR